MPTAAAPPPPAVAAVGRQPPSAALPPNSQGLLHKVHAAGWDEHPDMRSVVELLRMRCSDLQRSPLCMALCFHVQRQLDAHLDPPSSATLLAAQQSAALIDAAARWGPSLQQLLAAGHGLWALLECQHLSLHAAGAGKSSVAGAAEEARQSRNACQELRIQLQRDTRNFADDSWRFFGELPLGWRMAAAEAASCRGMRACSDSLSQLCPCPPRSRADQQLIPFGERQGLSGMAELRRFRTALS